MKINKENNRFENLLACKAYQRKKATCNFTYSVVLFF